MATAITRQLLSSYEGRHISTICAAVGFVDDKHNHCAHFVNHVLGFGQSLSCGQLLGRPGAAANIRVHETFAHCASVGVFEQRPAGPCLAFVTQRNAVDLARKVMTNIPKKHIGIFCDGEIWHYSNSDRKVVRQLPEVYAKHYSGAGFAVFFGTFPPGVSALLAPATETPDAVELAELRRGQEDNIDVANWQQFLIIRRLLNGPNIRTLLDGDFGPMTEDATEAFQMASGLKATGIVDAATVGAAVAQGFVPRERARHRPVLGAIGRAAITEAVEALHRMGSVSVFYTEEVVDVDGTHVIARLEPHKHSAGTQLRYWHRGITLYSL